jgi:AhpD family alkylhydroperoxidase
MTFEEELSQIVESGTDEACAGWMKSIEQEYGKIPLIFQRMAERPEVLVSHLLYKDAVTKTSALDPKHIELICLAVGAALKCVHCTGYHMSAALKMGATREEILETVLLAGLISNSSVLANAYRVIDDKLAKCVPCETQGIVSEHSDE